MVHERELLLLLLLLWLCDGRGRPLGLKRIPIFQNAFKVLWLPNFILQYHHSLDRLKGSGLRDSRFTPTLNTLNSTCPAASQRKRERVPRDSPQNPGVRLARVSCISLAAWRGCCRPTGAFYFFKVRGPKQL